MKRKILTFTNKISHTLNKPERKFISHITYGMLASGSCLLTNVVNQLHEPSKKINIVDRLAIDEMFPAFILPLMVEAVLLPFEGKIIYDSLLMPYQVNFGSGAKKGFQQEYRELKNKSGIITSLE